MMNPCPGGGGMDWLTEALVTEAPAIIARAVTTRNRCVFATGVGIQVLRYFGVDGVPYLVNAGAMNQEWADWERAGREGDPVALGAYAVVVSDEAQGPGLSGHLVIHVPAWETLLDLDLQQFRREHKGIRPPDAAAFEFRMGRGVYQYSLPDGGVLLFRPADQDLWARSARTAPDWKRLLRGEYRAVVGELIRAVKGHQPATD